MSHVLRVNPRGAYLHAVATGDNTLQDVQEYMSEVREACLAHGCPRVLIEDNLRGPGLGTMAIYDIVTSGSENATSAVSMIAYMDINPEHATGDMKFAETLAVNRGLNVRVFTDRQEAESWLSA